MSTIDTDRTATNNDALRFDNSPQTHVIKAGVLVYSYAGFGSFSAVYGASDLSASVLFNYGHVVGDGYADGVVIRGVGARLVNGYGADITSFSDAVTLADNSKVENYGSISGLISVSVGGFSKISNFGTLSGDISTEVRSSVINAGQISGDVYLFFYGIENNSFSEVINSGNIDGDIFVKQSVDGPGFGKITNSGQIRGDITLGTKDDSVDNRGGHIIGDVALDDGADRFDNRGGRVDGVVAGGAGDDTYTIDAAALAIEERAGGGTDTIRAGTVSIDLRDWANIENATLLGGRSLSLTGDEGANVLTGNSGRSVLTGLEGDDTYYVSDATNRIVESANGGTDTVHATVNWTLSANVENLFLDAGTVATGNALANRIIGNAADNVLIGGAGADTLDGGSGGYDTASYANAAAAVRAVLSTPSSNTGEAAGDVYIGIENLTGSNFADKLTGDNNSNVLDGGLGADTLTGGKGADVYYVDDAGDQVVEAGAGGEIDEVRSTVTYTLANNVENLELLGSSAINATGNNLANLLHGNGAANVLNGLGGADYLYGGDGADIFVFQGAFGQDYIEDFAAGSAAGHDVIQLDKTAFANFAAVMSHATETNNDGHYITTITSGANTITLDFVQKAMLTSADFLFV